MTTRFTVSDAVKFLLFKDDFYPFRTFNVS